MLITFILYCIGRHSAPPNCCLLIVYDRLCYVHLNPAKGFVQVSDGAIHLDNNDSTNGDSAKQFHDKEFV